jgi:hypothetical protein
MGLGFINLQHIIFIKRPLYIYTQFKIIILLQNICYIMDIY